MKNSFVVYYEIIEQLEDFTDEQVGKIFRAMVDYDRDGTIPNFTGTMKLAFKFIKQNLDINKEKYKNICERNRANIRKRWEEDIPDDTKNTSGKFGIPNDTKVYQDIPDDTKNTSGKFGIPNDTKVYQDIPDDTKNTDNDIDNDNDIDIDNVIESKKVSKKEEKEILSNTHVRTRTYESYDEIFATFGVSPELKSVLIDFIRHCQVNGRIVTNEKLKNIIIRLDFNCSTEVEKIHSVKRAINGGYFDIREERV